MKPIDPQLHQDTDALQRVILSGMRLLYDPKTFPMFKEGISTGQPLPDILAIQTAGIIKLLEKKANNQIPKQVIAPAAVMILAEIAKFMNEAGLVKPTEDDVKAGIQKMLEIIMKIYSPVSPSQSGGASPAGGNPEETLPSAEPPVSAEVPPEVPAVEPVPPGGQPPGLLNQPIPGA